jgi:threonine aldolase
LSDCCCSGLSIDPSVVETNILYVNVTATNVSAKALVDALKLEGVLLSLTAADRFRIVTHYQISASDVPIALEKIAKCMSTLMQQ